MKCLLLFASTTGRTREVFGELNDNLAGHKVEKHELGRGRLALSLSDPDLVFLGTPSYGKGDFHYLWTDHLDLLDHFTKASRVALIGLGDERFHHPTFGLGLVRLAAEVERRGLKVVGAYERTAKFSPINYLSKVVWPGALFDLRLERATWRSSLKSWMNHVFDECGRVRE